MKLISIKKLENGDWFIDGNSKFIASLVCFILFFVLISLTSWNIKIGLISSSIITFIITIWVIIDDLIGKRRHQKILTSTLFKDFKKDGFETEEFGEYRGLVKSNSNRTLRVYYEWNKDAKGTFSFGDIVINIFFEPLLEFDPNGDTVDSEKFSKKIEELQQTYQKKRSSSIKYYFSFDRMTIHTNYYPWTTHTKIQTIIDEAMTVIRREKLAPFDIKNLDSKYLEIEKNGNFLPQFQLIYNELE
jgi:hypothetical protein